MRYDVFISRKQIRVPNSTRLGFSKQMAQVGDMIQFQDPTRPDGPQIGRVLGQIRVDGVDWILTIALNQRLTHMCERWVNPVHVVECWNPKESGYDPIALLQGLMSDEIVKPSNQTLARRCSSELWSSWDKFKAWLATTK